MSEAQKIMAEVAARHPLQYDEYADQFGSAFQCKCGWQPDEETAPDNDFEAVDLAHGYHLAAEIDTALGGLTRETVREQVPYGDSTNGAMPTAWRKPRTRYRWVSVGWSESRP